MEIKGEQKDQKITVSALFTWVLQPLTLFFAFLKTITKNLQQQT